MSAVPELVTLHLWTVAPRHAPAALWRMARDRSAIRRLPGVTFAKLLGTGSGSTFTVRDADPLRWGLLTCWSPASEASGFERSPIAAAWTRLATSHSRIDLRPISARGRWARRQPFGSPRSERWPGPVAAVTRARISPKSTLTFWRAVPPVSAALHNASGLRFAIGIGEAPVGLQGTFSVWDSSEALTAFAYRGAQHAAVIERTPTEKWYAEEFFSRLAVLGISGDLGGGGGSQLQGR